MCITYVSEFYYLRGEGAGAFIYRLLSVTGSVLLREQGYPDTSNLPYPWAEGPWWPENSFRHKDPKTGSWQWGCTHRGLWVGTASTCPAGTCRVTRG